MDLASLGFHVDSSGLRRATGDLDRLDGRGRTATATVQRLGTALVSLGAAAVVAGAIKGSLDSFAEFERRLIGVGKTTNITGAELADLGQSVRELSRDLPVSASKLLEIAQSAGQLGVNGTANILRFTDTVGKLGLASDLSGEQAATSLARILTVTGTAISEVDQLGSTIVQLGNNFAATESEIAAVATRVSQSTSQFDVSAAQVLGISTALKAVGVQAESGGTQVGLSFQAINDAIRNGGDELARLEQITGRTGDALREDFFNGNSAKVFQDFVNGLGQIQQSGGDVSASLEAMGLKGVRATQVLGTLATRTDVLADALSQANSEWDSNIALNKEAAIASESFSAQLQLVKNAADEAASAVGSIIAPAALDGLDSFRDASLAVADNIETVADAAAVVAIVIGGSLTGALTKSAAGWVANTAAAIQNTNAQAAASAALLRRTSSEKAVALALVNTSRLDVVATARTNAHTFAITALSAARQRAAVAAGAHAAATATATRAITFGTVAARGLTGALALLGGPIGILTIAASAAFVFREALFGAGKGTEELTKDTKALVTELGKATAAQKNLINVQFQKSIEEQKTAIVESESAISLSAQSIKFWSANQAEGEGVVKELRQEIEKEKLSIDNAKSSIEAITERQTEFWKEVDKSGEKVDDLTTSTDAGTKSTDTASAAVTKIISALQDETLQLTLTDAQLLRHDLASQGASVSQIVLAGSILKTNEGLREQAANQANLVSGAERFAESIKTPTQLFDEQIVRLNEWRSTIDETTGKALISLAQYRAGVEQAGDELADLTKKQDKNEESLLGMKEAAQDWGRSFADQLVEGGLNFEKFANGILKQLQKIALEKAFAPVFGAFGEGLGSIAQGIFSSGSGSSIGTGNSPFFDNTVGPLPSADGGGFTGSGSRSGGVDGIGGFPAILHPNETIIDHTKGQQSSSSSVNIVVNVDASGSNATGDQDGKQIGDMIGVAVRSVLIDESRPGGLLSG